MAENGAAQELSEETRVQLRTHVDHIIARANNGPIEILLVPIGQEPAMPNADSIELAYETWERARHKFVWSREDIGASAGVIAATVLAINIHEDLPKLQPIGSGQIPGDIYKVRFSRTSEELYVPVLGALGSFWLTHLRSEEKFFFLYLRNVQVSDLVQFEDLPRSRPTTLYQHFQSVYAAITQIDMYDEDAEFYARLFGFRYDDHKPKRFSTLAKRSLNRRRAVDLRTRVRILDRDNSTCQVCGRTAPDVKVVVDHRIPVVAGGSNDDDNLWTLCEECNVGKSDLPFFSG